MAGRSSVPTGRHTATALVICTLLPAACATRGVSGDWPLFGHDLSNTFFNPTPSRPTEGSYRLRLGAFVPHLSRTCFVADSDGDGRLELFGTRREWVEGREVRHAILVDLDRASSVAPESRRAVADTLARGTILCPVPGGEARFLVISDSLNYEPAPSPLARSATRLFVENYARESNITRAERFGRALTEAALGETLNSISRLSVIDAGGRMLRSVDLGQRFKAESGSGLAFTSGAREIAVVTSDGGTQDSDLVFALVDIPRLKQDEVDMRRGVLSPGRGFRGIVAVDLDDGTVRWSRQCGASPRVRAAADLNDDGLDDMVVVTYSPENGASGGGTTDRSCGYVLCVDQAGNEIWRYRLSGRFTDTHAAIADVLGDGEPEVIVAACARLNEAQGEISILSGTGELINRRRSYGGALGLCLADLNDDGTPEIIFGGSQGRLFVLDSELNTVAEYGQPGSPDWDNWRVTPIAANDMDGDGAIEIIAVSSAWNRRPRPGRPAAALDDANNIVTVFGPALEPEAGFPIPQPGPDACVTRRGGSHAHNWMVVDMNGDELNDVVLTSRSTGGYVIFMEEHYADQAAPR